MKRVLWIVALCALAFSFLGCGHLPPRQDQCVRAEQALAGTRVALNGMRALCGLDDSDKCIRSLEIAKASVDAAELIRDEVCSK